MTANLTGPPDADATVIEQSWAKPEQFAAIFERYFGQIHQYLARRVGDKTADDLAADVFVTAFAQRQRYDMARDCARPWLYGIATNLVGTYWRQEERRYRAGRRDPGLIQRRRSGRRPRQRLLPNMFWLDGANIPSAVRAGNTLQLEADPFDDSQPGHEIGLVGPSGPARATGTYQIDQNGVKIASGDAVAAAKFGMFYTTATLSPQPSTIRFSLAYTRSSADFPLSTATSTVWAWRSAPVTRGELPPGWSCVRFTYQPRSCAAQPMMTLGYVVAGMRLTGATKPGRQVLHLTVGHLQAAKAAPVTKMSASVSFDGGTTWHPARVTGSGGSYTAVFTAPAGAKVTLRTSAADAAGGSVAETITSAYQIGS